MNRRFDLFKHLPEYSISPDLKQEAENENMKHCRVNHYISSEMEVTPPKPGLKLRLAGRQHFPPFTARKTFVSTPSVLWLRAVMVRQDQVAALRRPDSLTTTLPCLSRGRRSDLPPTGAACKEEEVER